MQLSDATLILFTALSSVRVFAYVPQIVQAVRDTTGCKAISTTTWLLFLFSHVATAAYAVVNLGDLAMAFVFGANAVCCLAILAVVWHKRGARFATGEGLKPRMRVVHSLDAQPLSGLQKPLGTPR